MLDDDVYGSSKCDLLQQFIDDRSYSKVHSMMSGVNKYFTIFHVRPLRILNRGIDAATCDLRYGANVP